MNDKITSSLLIVLALLFSAFAYRPVPALAQATGPAIPVQAGPTNSFELAAFFDQAITSEMETSHFPGAAVSVVKDGQVIFEKGYGYADLEMQTPVDSATTMFRIGSTTKLFTWTAVMQLAEQGKLDLDKDVNSYLDFTIPSTFPQPITLKNLMSHTPGFEERNDGGFVTRAEDMVPLGEFLRNQIPARVFPPGKVASYSNYGAALAGYIVERVSGMPFTEYIEKNILAPLGMTHSTLRQPVPADLAPDLSKGYKYAQDQYTGAGFEYAVGYPEGSASSTAADMTKFMLAHLQDGRLGDARILSEQTARQMHSQLFTADPRIPGMAYGFIESRVNGHRVLWHGGDTLIFHSNLWLLPDENTGIFITTNGTGGVAIAAMLIYEYMDRYYPVAPGPVPTPSAGFADRVKPYLGTYYSTRRNFTTFESLMAGLPPWTLSLDGKDNLILSVGGGSMQLVEVEPGLLTDPASPNVEFVLKTDDSGQAYILSSDPWPYMKIPWYGTTEFRDRLVQVGVLLFLASLISWGIAALLAWRKHGKGERGPLLPGLARWVGALFGPVLLVLFVGLDSLLKTRDAAFGYATMLIDKPPIFYGIMVLPYILAGLALMMLVFTVLAWIRRYWNWGDRLHYTVLTVAAACVVWGLWYWNLLF